MAPQLHEVRDLAAPGGEPFVLTLNSAINWLYALAQMRVCAWRLGRVPDRGRSHFAKRGVSAGGTARAAGARLNPSDFAARVREQSGYRNGYISALTRLRRAINRLRALSEFKNACSQTLRLTTDSGWPGNSGDGLRDLVILNPYRCQVAVARYRDRGASPFAQRLDTRQIADIPATAQGLD